MGGFKALGFQPDTRIAVFVFGLVHGFGLATKLQEYSLSRNGLVTNIVSFNGGVEIGQFLALTAVLLALGYWRTRAGYLRHAYVDECRADDGRLCARRLSDDRLFHGGTMTSTTEAHNGSPSLAVDAGEDDRDRGRRGRRPPRDDRVAGGIRHRSDRNRPLARTDGNRVSAADTPVEQ